MTCDPIFGKVENLPSVSCKYAHVKSIVN
jgi:hypothetical protein